MDEFEELDGDFPNIHSLFMYYNDLYFGGVLGTTTVTWSSKRMTSCGGICKYHPLSGCEIRLSEPLLKLRPVRDLKMVLLHEMIHAHNMTLRIRDPDPGGHGPPFVALMNKINTSTVPDPQRPPGGYNITTTHSMHGEVANYQTHWWECERCKKVIKRAMNRPPQEADCIGRTGARGAACNHPRCGYHTHLRECGGAFIKIREPPPKPKESRSKSPTKRHQQQQQQREHKPPLPPGQRRLDDVLRGSKRHAEGPPGEPAAVGSTGGSGSAGGGEPGHLVSRPRTDGPPGSQPQQQPLPTRRLPKPPQGPVGTTAAPAGGAAGAGAAAAAGGAGADASGGGRLGGPARGLISGSATGPDPGSPPVAGGAGQTRSTAGPGAAGPGPTVSATSQSGSGPGTSSGAGDGGEAPSAEELRRRCAEAALARLGGGGPRPPQPTSDVSTAAAAAGAADSAAAARPTALGTGMSLDAGKAAEGAGPPGSGSGVSSSALDAAGCSGVDRGGSCAAGGGVGRGLGGKQPDGRGDSTLSRVIHAILDSDEDEEAGQQPLQQEQKPKLGAGALPGQWMASESEAGRLPAAAEESRAAGPSKAASLSGGAGSGSAQVPSGREAPGRGSGRPAPAAVEVVDLVDDD